MRGLGAFGRQGLIMILSGRVRIERQMELSRQRNSNRAGSGRRRAAVPRMALARSAAWQPALGDDADIDVVTIGQAEMLFRRHITKHGSAEPADHGGADRAGNMVVAGRDIGGQRPERVEGRFATGLDLLVHMTLILCIGRGPPSIITCTSCFHAIWVSSPSVASSANCARHWHRRSIRGEGRHRLKAMS